MIIGLSMKETAQIAIFDRLKNGEITQKAAARALGMTAKWVRAKFRRFIAEGAKGLVHRNRNKPSNRRWSAEKRTKAMNICKTEFVGFGPTFAAEKLLELYGIGISSETLRKEMMREGLWSKKRRRSKHRTQRERKEYYGEMIQLDGSPHDWFEGRGPRCTLINFVDDATGRIPVMMLAPAESCESVFMTFRQYIEQHGIPRSLYVDYGGVFSVNTNNQDREKTTQFKRACDELDVKLIFASSPQAKGRVERSHATHQDRLAKELRLAEIADIKTANEFILSTYLPKHNAKFAVKLIGKTDIHRPANHLNLNRILCLKETRVLQNDYTLSYKKRTLQLTKHQQTVIRPKDHITIHEQFNGTLEIFIRNIQLNFVELAERPPKSKEKPILKQSIYTKPAANHPWRNYTKTQLSAHPNGGY